MKEKHLGLLLSERKHSIAHINQHTLTHWMQGLKKLKNKHWQDESKAFGMDIIKKFVQHLEYVREVTTVPEKFLQHLECVHEVTTVSKKELLWNF